MRVFIEDPRTGETLKRCSKCGKYKVLTEYYKDSTHMYGVQTRCKICQSTRIYDDEKDRFWKTFHKKTVQVNNCLEWTGRTGSHGDLPQYGKRNLNVRRIVYRLSVGELSDDSFIIMKCNNKKCVRQGHMKVLSKELFLARMNNLAPIGDNNGARMHPDRIARGSRVASSILTENDIIRIRTMCETIPQNKVAGMFGVSPSAINLIIKRKTWTHVQ